LYVCLLLLYHRLGRRSHLPLVPNALSIRLACGVVLGGQSGLGESLIVCEESI
jgi:hypothetical protein